MLKLLRKQIVHKIANVFNDLNVAALRRATNVKSRAWLRVLKHGYERPRVVLHMQPIANIIPDSIDWQRLSR
jgi:hypothetical protein